MGALLTPRWHRAVLSPPQLAYVNSRARINAVVAGRRSFKTEGAKRRLVRRAIEFTEYSDGRFFATAPTNQQAKDIFWEDLKALVPEWALLGGSRRASVSDSELTIDLANGARLKVAGMDKPQRIEGRDWDGGVITEFGNCKPNVFSEIVRPMMTRGGWVDVEGVPEGRNHYYEFVCDVRADRVSGAALHEWTTEETLHLWLGRERAEQELAAARRSMDALVYQQEYLARFVSFEGQAYYALDRGLNVASAAGPPERGPALYDPDLPLVLCFDFNRNPGVCAYVQEHPAARYPWLPRVPESGEVTAVIGEVFIRRHSNTRKVCERILADWGERHRGEVYVYGDATGGAKKSAAEGSDWEVIEAHLRPVFGHRYRDRVERSNPAERARVNSMNARLVAADGTVGMIVDSRAAPNVLRDLEGVEANDAGEIVKEQGSPLTHISDAIGYYVHSRFPIGGGHTTSVEAA